MRTFVAIEIPSEVRAAISALQSELRGADSDVSWTRPEIVHLTLKFLGEIEESRIPEIQRACESIGQKSSPFRLVLNGPGAFPDSRRPRVLWVGLSGETAQLIQLQVSLEEGLSKVGFARDEKPFLPHLTIGRVRSNRNTRALMSLARKYDLPALSFVASEIELMRSQLHPTGARHTCLAKAAFGN